MFFDTTSLFIYKTKEYVNYIKITQCFLLMAAYGVHISRVGLFFEVLIWTICQNRFTYQLLNHFSSCFGTGVTNSNEPPSRFCFVPITAGYELTPSFLWPL